MTCNRVTPLPRHKQSNSNQCHLKVLSRCPIPTIHVPVVQPPGSYFKYTHVCYYTCGHTCNTASSPVPCEELHIVHVTVPGDKSDAGPRVVLLYGL